MSILDEIKTPDGELRRLGSLVLPQGNVCSLPAFEDNFEVWDMATIIKVITAPGQVPASVRFPEEKWNKNQRSHGSCNGFAYARAFSETRYDLGIDDGFQSSGAWLYSLMNGGRDDGSQLLDGMKVGETVGHCSADLVTWDMIYPRLQPLAKAKAEAKKHRAIRSYRCRTIMAWFTALAQRWKGVAAVHAGNRYLQFRNGIAGVDHGPGNHAVCVDGLRQVRGTLVMDQPGSWGLSGGGVNGRWTLVRDHIEETFPNHAFCVLRGVEETK